MRWRNRYNVAPPEERRVRGKTYASKAERQYADRMYALRDAGVVRLVLEQTTLWLGVPENTYRPDFFVIEADGTAYFVDVKGVETQAFRKTKKLWAAYGPAPLHIVKKKKHEFLTAQVIEGGMAWKPR